jgi:polysaccharide chain length determinant protein (PEP-CTERM system associated)
MQEQLDNVLNILRGMWRYRWWALGMAWLVSLAGWVAVSQMPDMYEAEATVYVDTDSMLRPLLSGLTVEVDVGEKLGFMTKQLLSRAKLEKVASLAGMYGDPGAASDEEVSEAISQLQRNIRLRESRTTRARRSAPDLYVVAYRNSDPVIAARVVEALVETFMESTVGDSRERSDVAQAFLGQQIEEYERLLTEAESRLREFKQRNINVLPEQGSGYYQRLQSARSALEEVQLQIREAEYRRSELDRQMRGTPVNQRATAAGGAPVLTPTEQRLAVLQAHLDELELKYTSEHPDVIETRRSIFELEKQRDAELQALAAGDNSSAAAANPVYQQLRLALGEVDAELAALRVRRSEYQARVSRLEQQIEVLPEVEAELQSLNRDYEVYRDQYNQLLTRRESARISEDVEATGEDVRFRLIEPARVPMAPAAPDRLVLNAQVLIAALGVGGGLAFLLTQFRPALFGERALRQLSGLPVFGSVSLVQTAAARWRRRLSTTVFFAGTAMLVPAFGIAAFLQLSDAGLQGLLGVFGAST